MALIEALQLWINNLEPFFLVDYLAGEPSNWCIEHQEAYLLLHSASSGIHGG